MSQVPYSPKQPSYPPYVRNTEKDWMGIVSLIGAFVFPIVGIVFGHLGMKAYREGEASNNSIAKIGLILSYVFTGLSVLGFLYALILAATVSST